MADLTKTEGAYRALLIPDPKFTYEALDLENSVITQRGARAGVPVPAAPTKAVLSATGEQEDVELTIRTVRGGLVDPDYAGASFVWESSDKEGTYGWETPTAVRSVEDVAYTTPTYARDLTRNPSAVALPSGTLVVAYARQTSSFTDTITTRRKVAGLWSSPVSLGLPSEPAGGEEALTALVWDEALSQVRLYVLQRDISLSGQEVGRLSLYASDDEGASWSLSQEDCLIDTFDWSSGTTGYTVQKMSLALNAGQGCLLLSVTMNDTSEVFRLRNTVIQYMSTDNGLSFDLIDIYAPSVTSLDDPLAGVGYTVFRNPRGPGFKVVWSSSTDSSFTRGALTTATIGSGAVAWSYTFAEAVDETTSNISFITSNVMDDVSIAVAVDDSGGAWLYYVGNEAYDSANSYPVRYMRYEDTRFIHPATSPFGYDTPGIIRMGDADEYVDQLAAVWNRGSVSLFGHVQSGSSSVSPGGLLDFTLGGYSTACRQPAGLTAATRTLNASYDFDWYGLVPMSAITEWTVSTFGSVSVATGVSFAQTIVTSLGGTYTATANSQPLSTDGQFHAQMVVEVTSGNCDFLFKIADKNHLRIRVTASQAVLRDMDTSTDLETIVFPTASGKHIIRIGWHEYSFGSEAYYAFSAGDVPLYNTGQLMETTSGVLSTATSAGSYFRFFVGSVSSDVSLYQFSFGSGNNGSGLGSDRVTGRPYWYSPSYVYGSTSVAMVNGPTTVGDEWTISPRYDYGIKRVFQEIEPSPRAVFQSTASASSTPTALVFDLQDGGEASRFGRSVLGMGLFGANFRTAYIQTASAATGPWTTIKTIDMSCGLNGLAWERTGHTVSAPTSSPATGPHYIAENALAGSYFQYKSGEMVKILRNSGGLWQEGANVARARLMLSGASADASGSAGVIVYKDAVVLIYGLASVSFMRLLIPAQDTYGDTLELGSLVFGRVEILGKQYARGRSLEIAPNLELVEQVNGARKSRKLGPSRRSMAINWANENPIDTKQLWGDLDNVDYVRASAGLTPAAIPAATAHQVAGLVDQLEGEPLVYISKLTPDQPTMIAPTSLLRGRVLGPVTLDHFDGDEEEDELIRVASIVIEEEV